MTEDQKDINFDFYKNSTEKEKARHQANADKKAKADSFFRIGRNTLLAIGAVVVLGGGSYLINNAYQKHVDQQIATRQADVTATDKDGVTGLIKKEIGVSQQTFAKNQMLINDFGHYKDLIEMIHFGNQVAIFNTNNAKLFKQTNDSLNADLMSVNRVYNAVNGTRDEKIQEFIDSTDLKQLTQWNTNVQNKQFMYVGGLVDLNKDLVNQLQFLNKTQNEVIQTVQERLKNKDFDLNTAQTQFAGQINQEANDQIDDLKQARAELKDTEDAMKEEDEDSSQISNLLTDADVNNASTAMDTVKTEAMDQVNQDKAKVEALIAQANANNGTLATPQASNNTVINGSVAPQVVHVHSGPSFLDYYLMYSWMNMGSTGNTTVINNNYGGGNSNYANNRTTVPARTYQPIKALNTSINPYSLKNENSYLNKTLTQKADATGNSALKSSLGKTSAAANTAAARPNINALRAQINTARARASQVRTTRATELSRMGYEGTKSSGTSTSSRGVKSSTSISSSRGIKAGGSSSISRGSFGGHSGGFGG